MAEEPRRIIHVKGVGHASQAPDQVTISITLEAQDKDYSRAVGIIADKIAALRKSVTDAGFDTNELITEAFSVKKNTDYEYLENGTRREIFLGYVAEHHVKLSFDFITEKFNKALVTLTDCLSNPKISVSFKLKDYTALKDRLWEDVAKDARHKAETLCTAAGFRLGKLLNVGCTPKDYKIENPSDWIDLLVDEQQFSGGGGDMSEEIFIPQDIVATESVDFFWEIID